MRGFLVGSLALIALEVLTRKANADQLVGAGALLVSAAHRFLSPGVAGIPNRSAPRTAAKPPPAGSARTPASAPAVGRTLTTQYV